MGPYQKHDNTDILNIDLNRITEEEWRSSINEENPEPNPKRRLSDPFNLSNNLDLTTENQQPSLSISERSFDIDDWMKDVPPNNQTTQIKSEPEIIATLISLLESDDEPTEPREEIVVSDIKNDPQYLMTRYHRTFDIKTEEKASAYCRIFHTLISCLFDPSTRRQALKHLEYLADKTNIVVQTLICFRWDTYARTDIFPNQREFLSIS